MFGKVVTTRIACALKRSVSSRLRTYSRSSRYIPHVLTRLYASDNSCQHLFQEILIWRRLTHPNILPVLGVSPKLFPLCIISGWMIDGNIMSFILKHPRVNRLRLVRPFSILPPIPES